ncbi:Uncharacterised protein [Klebsiella pneumoniae]|nr:Uncharacterised protein [Klebsiella pneumoniae]SLO29012.1 Uncharacterised protein [Klebsiella pneumoniae]SLO32629.1 Uncharacterised protein [Klebsiella pneumoniae]SLO35783.1 Uncharacterised protein [Klebsiella pneumoniae]SLO44918.1 Uncharacterised protein [Klebsiella pneumoniae]
MARRQLNPLFRHQAQERVVLRLRRIMMYMLQHLLIAVRTGDLQHLRMHFADLILFRAETAGDDYLAVLFQRFADRFQRFLHSAINKAAGVNDHHIGVVVGRYDVITFGAQFGQDTL